MDAFNFTQYYTNILGLTSQNQCSDTQGNGSS